MSFDLAVWHSETPLTGREAQGIYAKLCENWPYLEGTQPTVDAFYRELTEKWPEIDTIPEEKVDDFDFCPWSCALNHSGMAIVLSCVWPKAEEVAKRTIELAEKHQLVLYDPQTNGVVLPSSLQNRKRPWHKRLFGGGN
jgi:hypothetical protein